MFKNTKEIRICVRQIYGSNIYLPLHQMISNFKKIFSSYFDSFFAFLVLSDLMYVTRICLNIRSDVTVIGGRKKKQNMKGTADIRRGEERRGEGRQGKQK